MISESAEEARRRWEYWLKGKRAEVIARTHLSLVTAVLLAGGVMWREWSDLVHTLMALNLVEWSLFVAIITSPIVVARYLWIWTIFDEPGWREDVVVWTVLTVLFLSLPALPNLVTKVIRVENQNPLSFPVLILTAATLGAAIWEILGEKLGSSERDVRFALHVHKLLRLLDGFYITNDGNTPPDRALGEFTQEVIESACETLCGRKVVSGGYLQPQKGNVLKLCKVSSNAQYDPKLAIPISPRKQPGPGPAAHAFKQTEIPYHPVYMPEREREEAWLAEVKTDGEYRFPPPTQVGWVAAEQPELQDFHSVLCVLTRHFTTDRTDNVGILTFSTRKRDPFLPNDFLMAECFARILAQATAIARQLENKK